MIDYKLILNGQIDKLNTVGSGNDFNVWQSHTLNILRRVFGDDSQQVKQLEDIKYRVSHPMSSLPSRRSMFSEYKPVANRESTNNLTHCINTSRKLVAAFIEELEVLGLPDPKVSSTSSGININVSQTQQINLSIVIHSLREELTGRQFQELEEIVKSDVKPEEKKQKISEKLKSFGSDVLSGVLSSLLTNPQVYQAFM